MIEADGLAVTVAPDGAWKVEWLQQDGRVLHRKLFERGTAEDQMRAELCAADAVARAKVARAKAQAFEADTIRYEVEF